MANMNKIVSIEQLYDDKKGLANIIGLEAYKKTCKALWRKLHLHQQV